MTVKFEYLCDACGHDYVEQRAAEESPFFTSCHVCGNDYKEVAQTILAEEVERVAAPAVEEIPAE